MTAAQDTIAPPATSVPPATTVPAAPPPTTVVGPGVEGAVADAAADVVEGQITHNVPRSMTEGQTSPVVVRVGSRATAKRFTKAVESSGATVSEEEQRNVEGLPKVAPEMKIILSAPPSFEVRAENSERQVLGDDGVARWGYQVEPTEPGEHEVRITAEIIVGESVESLEPVYDGTIIVDVADTSLLEDIRTRSEGLVQLLLLIFAAASAVGGLVALRDYRARNRVTAQPSPQSVDADDDAPPSTPAAPPPADFERPPARPRSLSR